MLIYFYGCLPIDILQVVTEFHSLRLSLRHLLLHYLDGVPELINLRYLLILYLTSKCTLFIQNGLSFSHGNSALRTEFDIGVAG